MQPHKIQQEVSPLELQKEREAEFSVTDIWSFLQNKGMVQMIDLAMMLHRAAPAPGALVYIQARPLPYRWKKWQPVLFSSIDVCTHLQIAKVYLTPTLAAAVDFLDFVVEKSPFPIAEVRTPADGLFTNSITLQSDHHFTTEARKYAIYHTIASEPANDSVIAVVSRYLYDESFDNHGEEPTEEKLMKELVNFLFFHNNHRSIPSLAGRTPVQKLRTFEGYDHIEWYDPYEILESRRTRKLTAQK